MIFQVRYASFLGAVFDMEYSNVRSTALLQQGVEMKTRRCIIRFKMHHSSSSWTVRVLPTTAFSEGLIMRNLTTLPSTACCSIAEEIRNIVLSFFMSKQNIFAQRTSGSI